MTTGAIGLRPPSPVTARNGPRSARSCRRLAATPTSRGRTVLRHHDPSQGVVLDRGERKPGGCALGCRPFERRELREVVLGGVRGARTVSVPPWHGIDTEMWFGFG